MKVGIKGRKETKQVTREKKGMRKEGNGSEKKRNRKN